MAERPAARYGAVTGAPHERALTVARHLILWSLVLASPAQADEFSISHFADPSARAMAQAVQRGEVQRALELAQSVPGGLNAAGSSGECVLTLAVDRGDWRMVEALLRAGANPNGPPDAAPLHQAVMVRDRTILRALLAAGADPDATMGSETALYEAALIGAKDAAALLLDAGAHVDHRDELGGTAVFEAAAANQWSTVELLLDRGASMWVTLPASGLTLGAMTNSRLLRDRPEGQALTRVIARLQQAGYPWPPPEPAEVRRLVQEGRWPPVGAKLP